MQSKTVEINVMDNLAQFQTLTQLHVYVCLPPPHSFVEGVGFRSFMNTINPAYNKLSQRSLGLHLYEEVERNIKPQLIRDMKTSLLSTADGKKVVHITLDLWAGNQRSPVEDPIVVVQLHFINEAWQLRRPIVAFRQLSHRNLSAGVASELEAVLLGYGIYPKSIGYVLANQAKDILAGHSLFCDYKIMCASTRGEVVGDEFVDFLTDQMSGAKCPFSQLQIGTRTHCVTNMLQLVIKEALKNSRLVENLLKQVYNVLMFFRNSDYWSKVGQVHNQAFMF